MPRQGVLNAGDDSYSSTSSSSSQYRSEALYSSAGSFMIEYASVLRAAQTAILERVYSGSY
jgi:hypothetical protein